MPEENQVQQVNPQSDNELLIGAGIDPKLIDTYVSDDVKRRLAERWGSPIAEGFAAKVELKETLRKAAAKESDLIRKSVFEEELKGTDIPAEQADSEFKTWLSTVKSPQEVKELEKAMKVGGRVAKAVLRDYVAEFKAASNFSQPVNFVTGEHAQSVTSLLSKDQYLTEFGKMLESGKAYDSPEVQALRNRRLQSIGRV